MQDQIAEVNPDALFADGFAAALIGYVERFGQPPLALYDKEACLALIMAESECPEDDPCDPLANGDCEHVYFMAQEHFDFNIIGAWVGDSTPAYATLLKPK
jgi:hypothetical protein